MTTREIIASCEPEKDRIDNYLYTYNKSDKVEQVYLSPKGFRLHQLGSGLAELADLPNEPRPDQEVYHGLENNTSSVTKEFLVVFGETIEFAVKRIFPSRYTLTGLEQLLAMRILADNGVILAEPQIALLTRLVTRWENGELVSKNDAYFPQYLQYLLDLRKKLIGDDLWTPIWRIDLHRENYRRNNSNTDNIADMFTAIDPVYSDFREGEAISRSWRITRLDPARVVMSVI